MPPETEEKEITKPEPDPHFLAKYREITGKSIDDVLEPDDEPAKTEDDAFGRFIIPEPIGIQRSAEKGNLLPKPDAPPPTEEDKKKADEEAEAAANKKTADDAAAQKLVADEEAAKNATRPVIKLVKREPESLPPPQPKKEPTAEEKAAAAQATQDTQYEQTLDEDSRRLVEIARYAEAKGESGLTDRTFKYLRETDKFMEDHPDLTVESDEFKEFNRENDPFAGKNLKRLEIRMEADAAEARAFERARQESESLSREVREMKLKPKIETAVATVSTALTTADPKQPDIRAIDQAVIEKINRDGYDAAVKEFPVEAPIVQGAVNATREWLELSSGVKPFDANNQTHAWLVSFVAREGANMLRQPESVRVVDGRSFMPLHQYMQLQSENPAAAARHYSFTDDMIVDLIANSGQLAYSQQVETLEKSGWKREPAKISKAVKNGSAPAVNDDASGNASPKAGSKSLSGPPGSGKNDSDTLINFPQLRSILEMEEKGH